MAYDTLNITIGHIPLLTRVDGPILCWFCRKGRHADCMKSIPVSSISEGPHDCTFDTQMVLCECTRCEGTHQTQNNP